MLPLLPLSVPEAFASGSQFTPPQTVCEARLDWRWGDGDRHRQRAEEVHNLSLSITVIGLGAAHPGTDASRARVM